jgi:hypothetical protein
MLDADFNFDALFLFDVMQNTQQIPGRWIAAWPEHSNETLGIFAS